MSLDYEELDRKRKIAVALKRAHSLTLRDCFDPYNPASRATPKQDTIMRDMKDALFQWVMGGNQSGKSSLGARIVTWFFKREHPYMDLNKLWPAEPLVILVVGRLNAQVEELWERKIRPFLTPGEYRENRQGGTLQFVEHTTTKCKIIFATHNDPINAREKLQSYTAHLVWLDELTDHLGIIEELQRRVQAKRGRMIATFTPKLRAEAVKRFIETETPYSRCYKISMLDNPIYDDRREEVLSQIMGLPEAQRNTILYGDWYSGEQAVFHYDQAHHKVDTIPGYTTLWPHIACVDPAASGLMGYTLWAAPTPNSFTWYNTAAGYLKGAAPTDLIASMESIIKGMQVIGRICDTHESWYVKEAIKQKIFYKVVDNKRGRKKELIANFNQALANGRIKLTSQSGEFESELQIAQWSETAVDKIVNASSFHIADTGQYFVDLIPQFKNAETRDVTYDEILRRANKARLDQKSPDKKKQTWRIVAKGGKVWKR